MDVITMYAAFLKHELWNCILSHMDLHLKALLGEEGEETDSLRETVLLINIVQFSDITKSKL